MFRFLLSMLAKISPMLGLVTFLTLALGPRAMSELEALGWGFAVGVTPRALSHLSFGHPGAAAKSLLAPVKFAGASMLLLAVVLVASVFIGVALNYPIVACVAGGTFGFVLGFIEGPRGERLKTATAHALTVTALCAATLLAIWLITSILRSVEGSREPCEEYACRPD